MSQATISSSNYSQHKEDVINEFSLKSENSIDDPTGQEIQYSDKTLFDQDLNSHNIADNTEDRQSNWDHKQESVETEQHRIDSSNLFAGQNGTESEEINKEVSSEVVEENTPDTKKVDTCQEKGTSDQTGTILEDGEHDARLERNALNTGTNSENSISEVDAERVDCQERVDGQERVDSQNLQRIIQEDKKENLRRDQHENIRENQHITENEQQKANDWENNKDDFEGASRTTQENSENVHDTSVTDNGRETNNVDTCSKGNTQVEILDTVTCDSKLRSTEEKEKYPDSNETERTDLKTGDIDNEIKKEVVISGKDSEETEEKTADSSKARIHENNIQKSDDTLIERGESDSKRYANDAENHRPSPSPTKLEQEKDKYVAGEDNNDFWDVGETDKKKQNEVKDKIIETIVSSENVAAFKSGSEKESDRHLVENETLRSDIQEQETVKKPDEQDNFKSTEDTTSMEGSNGTNDEKSCKETTNLLEQVQQPEHGLETRESLLDQLLKRNVEIDGSIESISDLENNVTTLLRSMKIVIKHYGELLNEQSLRDFSQDMGKFRGDFLSINDAYRRCGQLATTMNNHLKELRHLTEDFKMTVYRKFQNEDLATWVDIPPEKESEKQKMQEEVIAAEKSAMAKAAEARAALATATVGVAEANQFVAEMETHAAEAEAVAKKASAVAKQALVVAEEARIAADEKRKTEEIAKQRAQERARKREEEEKKRRAEEEMKIYQEAARKGTSVDDERKLMEKEKETREAERRDPKNWPRYTYAVEAGDFDPRVGCIIRAIDGSMRKDDVKCRRIGQETGILPLTNNEELISNIIEVIPTDPERKLHFEEPMSVSLPVCIKRTPFAREAVIKVHQSNGKWVDLPTADVTFEDHRDQRFVESKTRKFGTFVVVLRYRRDTLMLLKKGGKVTSAVDSRVSVTARPEAFKVDSNFCLEIHPVDQNNISDLRVRASQECEDLYTCSPFIKLALPTRKSLIKPLTITLPLPPHHTRQKRPQTAVHRETARGTDARPATAKPQTTMDRKEESTEEVHFLYLDEKTGWTKNSKTVITLITNKDMVSFDILEPYQRCIVLRTKTGLKNSVVEKMALLLDRSLTKRNVKAFLRQRSEDLYDVAISCETSEKSNRAIKSLADEGFVEGGPPSKDLILKEGQSLFIRFRGNVHCVNKNPRLNLIFNTHIRCRTDLKVMELDTFAQKGLPCYRGFAQVFTRALVPKPDQEETTRKPNEPPELIEDEVLLTELLIEIPKAEDEQPKPITVVPVKLVDGPLNDDVLHHLAKELGKEWKDVAAKLNLNSTRIQAILRQNVNKDTAKTRYDMLVSWAKRVPRSVDKVQLLVHALQAAGRFDLAEEMRYRGDEYREQRSRSARGVSHLRQAFVKVAKTNSIFQRWKDFAKGIGVPDTEIQKIEEKGGSGQEKCYSSLEMWKDLSGEKATVQDLATHLKDVQQDRLSKDVQSLVAL